MTGAEIYLFFYTFLCYLISFTMSNERCFRNKVLLGPIQFCSEELLSLSVRQLPC